MNNYFKEIELGIYNNSFAKDKNVFEKIYLNLKLPITAFKKVIVG